MGAKDRLIKTKTALSVGLLALLMGGMQAHAARPLTVDDASVDDAGTGHVDNWVARDAAKAISIYSMPSYAFAKGFELDSLIARNTTEGINTLGLQLKALLTEPQKSGCNMAAVVGASRAQAKQATVDTPYVMGLLSCNQGDVALHINAGANKPTGQSTLASWGVAIEEYVSKDFSGHVEVFGQQGSQHTVQFGLRKLFGSLQLDGTIGQTDHVKVYTLGLKFTF